MSGNSSPKNSGNFIEKFVWKPCQRMTYTPDECTLIKLTQAEKSLRISPENTKQNWKITFTKKNNPPFLT